MRYGTAMRISLSLLLFSVFLGTNGDDDMCYVPKFTDSVFSCDNFNNEFMDLDDLKLGSSKGDEGDDGAKLSGKIKTLGDLISDYDVEIDIWKMMDMGDEYMYNTRINFCASMQNEDTPWYPVLQKLNVSSCPVPVSIFEVQGITICLDSVKDVMCHEYCGAYRIHLSFMDKTDKISCHVIEICIVEEECE